MYFFIKRCTKNGKTTNHNRNVTLLIIFLLREIKFLWRTWTKNYLYTERERGAGFALYWECVIIWELKYKNAGNSEESLPPIPLHATASKSVSPSNTNRIICFSCFISPSFPSLFRSITALALHIAGLVRNINGVASCTRYCPCWNHFHTLWSHC